MDGLHANKYAYEKIEMRDKTTDGISLLRKAGEKLFISNLENRKRMNINAYISKKTSRNTTARILKKLPINETKIIKRTVGGQECHTYRFRPLRDRKRFKKIPDEDPSPLKKTNFFNKNSNKDQKLKSVVHVVRKVKFSKSPTKAQSKLQKSVRQSK